MFNYSKLRGLLKLDIFSYNSHFDYLTHVLSGANSPRGTKGKLAEFLGVHPPYLSQILKKKYSLSLEQADQVNSFLDHSPDESSFFLMLVSRDRAGTVSLRDFLRPRLIQFLGSGKRSPRDWLIKSSSKRRQRRSTIPL